LLSCAVSKQFLRREKNFERKLSGPRINKQEGNKEASEKRNKKTKSK
jgi:hypothetical protein